MRGTGSALHETFGVLIDLELEAKSPLGFQQCRDHASPSAVVCTMWAQFVRDRLPRRSPVVQLQELRRNVDGEMGAVLYADKPRPQKCQKRFMKHSFRVMPAVPRAPSPRMACCWLRDPPAIGQTHVTQRPAQGQIGSYAGAACEVTVWLVAARV